MERSATDVMSKFIARVAAGDQSCSTTLIAEDLINHTSAPPWRLGIQMAAGRLKWT